MRTLLVALVAAQLSACQCGGPPVGDEDAGSTGGGAGGGGSTAGGAAGGGSSGSMDAAVLPVGLQLLLAGSPGALTCQSGRVRTLGDAGLAPTAIDVEVRLDGGPAYAFFGGADCSGAPSATVRIEAGSGDAQFRFRTRTFGPQPVIAEAAGLAPGVALPIATAILRVDRPRAVTPLLTCSPLAEVEVTTPNGLPVEAPGPTRVTVIIPRPFGGSARDAGCTDTQFDALLDAGQSRAVLFGTALGPPGATGFLQVSPLLPTGLSLGAARVELFAECLPGGTTCSGLEPCCAGSCDAGLCP